MATGSSIDTVTTEYETKENKIHRHIHINMYTHKVYR